jgi:hypothetical protein
MKTWGIRDSDIRRRPQIQELLELPTANATCPSSSNKIAWNLCKAVRAALVFTLKRNVVLDWAPYPEAFFAIVYAAQAFVVTFRRQN